MMRLVLIYMILTSSVVLHAQPNVYDYIYAHKDIAIEEMHRTGIPASIKLAQGLLESNIGQSPLSKIGNNHFGIKCGNSWEGKEIYKEDDDYGANNQLTKSCFRVFESAHESYIAHSEFLLNPRKSYRYGFLFSIPSHDYISWAKGLKKAGYATDPKYADKLISRIEDYALYQFDGSSAPMARINVPRMIRNIKDITYSHIVQLGESLQSIAEQYQMDPNILIHSNNIHSPIVVGQELSWSKHNSNNDATFNSSQQKLQTHASDTPD